MIDLTTYYKMYANKKPKLRLKDELGPKAMASEEPPGGDFVFLLPTDVRGFNLAEKNWKEFDVNGISDVAWNKEAFNSLVIQEDTKLLITAFDHQQNCRRQVDGSYQRQGLRPHDPFAWWAGHWQSMFFLLYYLPYL